jgi:hypothetical protein
MGGDGQTILNFAGTGTTKFSGGLFRGVNSYILGAPQYFWMDCFRWVETVYCTNLAVVTKDYS